MKDYHQKLPIKEHPRDFSKFLEVFEFQALVNQNCSKDTKVLIYYLKRGSQSTISGKIKINTMSNRPIRRKGTAAL